jgi:S-methylmethionine-dependent homocysteine/selenocysteine methylase
MEALQERIDQGDAIILDGGTGTELQRRGVPMHGVAWSAAALLTHPDTVREIHEDYIRAGADVIITNTFSAARHTLEEAGMGDSVAEANTRAVSLAKEARDVAAADRTVYVAGSVSTFFPGLQPELLPSAEQARASYREQAQLLAEAGVDLIILEMMRDVEQSAYAIEAAESTGLPTWVCFNCKMGSDGQVRLFDSEDETFAESLKSLLAPGAAVASVMHTDVDDATPALQVLRQRWDGPLGAYAHSGGFFMPDWQFDDVISPADYLSRAQESVQMGVQVVGGCCGTGPEHIRALRDGLPARVPAAEQGSEGAPRQQNDRP